MIQKYYSLLIGAPRPPQLVWVVPEIVAPHIVSECGETLWRVRVLLGHPNQARYMWRVQAKALGTRGHGKQSSVGLALILAALSAVVMAGGQAQVMAA